MRINYFISFALAILMCSCQSTPKNITYFQDLEQYLKNVPPSQLNQYPVINCGDHLTISVVASVANQELVSQFNITQNYIVDTEGYIEYPVLGRIRLVGKTKLEAIDCLADSISAYLPKPIVNMQFLGQRVTVIGEVNRPGPQTITNDRLTILEAIGAAGDLSIFGNRTNVLLIRETNGQKEFGYIDLTKADIFSSPYYYLQQNDVIVVDANATRKKAANFGSAENYQLSVYSMVLSTVSLLTTLFVTYMNL
ncbi:polysaccharide biosynthesis protein [Bacteroidia bacterium]|nr:polysaccharide biosynthesis protein [Bacteroidia bacterium]